MKTSRVIENGDRCVYCGFKVRFDVENVPQLDGFLDEYRSRQKDRRETT